MKTLSEYGRIFNSDNPYWSKDIRTNLIYLRARQSYLNDVLKARGHLTLNDVYDVLGFPRTSKGLVVGWVYEEDNKFGDNYVDFGIVTSECNDSSIPIEFNVDGIIFDRI